MMVITGCMTVGPDYTRPTLQVLEQWMQAEGHWVQTSPDDYRNWWAAFQDPVLDNVVQVACAQNIPLRVAGARVFEARARLGIAIGEQYPQVQQAVGAASYNRDSERSPLAPQNSNGTDFDYTVAQAGGRVSWEIDFWGRFRRLSNPRMRVSWVPSRPTTMPLVSLTADAARTYVLIRTLEERLKIARDNVVIQTESLRIAQARFQAGATSEATCSRRSASCGAPRPPFSDRGQPPAGQERACTLLGMLPRRLDPAGGPLRIPRPARGRRRHSRRPAPPPAGHPQRRFRPLPNAPSSRSQGRPLPGLRPEWGLRIPGERRGQIQPR
jgi:hypothetical protein